MARAHDYAQICSNIEDTFGSVKTALIDSNLTLHFVLMQRLLVTKRMLRCEICCKRFRSVYIYICISALYTYVDLRKSNTFENRCTKDL